LGKAAPLFTRPDRTGYYLGTMTVEKKVSATIAEHHLLAKGDSVLVALSGGPDSVALLYLLHDLRRRYKLALYAVYINHNLRKRAAGKEERFCADQCRKLGVELFIIREDIPSLARSSKMSIEQAAREFRYRVFAKLADEHAISKIAVGHHIDDRVETVLFRIIRGTGITGLRGILPCRGRIVRPLYELTKDEIMDYLKNKRIAYCLDQSNLGLEYDRNYIRNRLLVDIRRKLNPAVDRALLSLSEIAAEDEAFLQQYLIKRVGGLVRRTVGGKIELDLSKYNRYDKWFRRRLLRYCLAELSGPEKTPEKVVVDRLDRLCTAGGNSISIPGGLQAVSTGSSLVIYHRAAVNYSVPLSAGRVCRLKTLRLDIRMSVQSRGPARLERRKKAATVFVDYGRVEPPLVVRSIRPGDRFRPLGLEGTKKVGDYLTDRKVHPVYRDEIPVVCDRKGIIWLVGFEICHRVRIDIATGKVLKLGFRKRKES
jgi:tRNA(Ile)-lysidine synthase